MAEENKEASISFRSDKQTEMLNLRKNKFGHTLSRNTEDDTSDDNVNLSFGSSGTGVVAHVDIFDSPHLKKFLEDSDLDSMNSNEDEHLIDEIDLSEESELLNNPRPRTLEEFDLLADSILKPSNNPTKTKFASNESKQSKSCSTCRSLIKKDSKFCPNCGSPQTLAQFCKNCGNKFSLQEKFCCECGSKRE